MHARCFDVDFFMPGRTVFFLLFNINEWLIEISRLVLVSLFSGTSGFFSVFLLFLGERMVDRDLMLVLFLFLFFFSGTNGFFRDSEATNDYSDWSMKGWNLVPALLIFITFTTRIIEMESLEADGVVVPVVNW